ncbi:S-protein [Salix suchowensis]|nr:S-protein [Salix suchowensis]
MTSWINSLFFLALQLCFLSSATANEHDGHPLPTVHVINDLPKSSKPMSTLVNGEVYKWRVSQRKLHYCVAIWERFFASWHAFQPQDGFFISWDKAKWVKKYRWETE